MKEVWIRLPSTKQVQRFVSALTALPGDFELVDRQYVLDARSLMGIFGFDLSRPLRLKIYQDSPEALAAISPFLADMEGEIHEQ